MTCIVQKFGGTSVGNIERIKYVASLVEDEVKKQNKVVVVVSAMSGFTAELIQYSQEINPKINTVDDLILYDQIISSGEQITSSLLALELNTKNIKSTALLGWQIVIETDNNFSQAKITNIETQKIQQLLEKNIVPIIAGFQGYNKEYNRITTLGRGGSDITAIALSHYLKASRCDIYTDVKGVYTTDPRITKSARRLNKISYEEMLEMSSLGAKVLQYRSVEMAMKYRVRTRVLSTFDPDSGTTLVDNNEIMQRRDITGVTHDSNEALIKLSNILNISGKSSEIFRLLGEKKVPVDIIVQNYAPHNDYADVSFSLKRSQLKQASKILNEHKKLIGYQDLTPVSNLAKVSLIGIGMNSNFGVAGKMFDILSKENINIYLIATSEIKISVLIQEEYIELAVRAIHQGFELHKPKTNPIN